MSESSSSVWQPGTGTVYRATLDALAEHGPRRVGVTHIARRARCNRSYLYRHWRSTRALIRNATLAELGRVLDVARDMPGPLPPPGCLRVRVVVRAARLLREHPVVRTMAVADPELTHAAVLRPASDWHAMAWSWLHGHVTGHLPPGEERDRTTLAVLTTALPYALTPPTDCSAAEERATIDARLSTAVHLCLGASHPCSDCERPVNE